MVLDILLQFIVSLFQTAWCSVYDVSDDNSTQKIHVRKDCRVLRSRGSKLRIENLYKTASPLKQVSELEKKAPCMMIRVERTKSLKWHRCMRCGDRHALYLGFQLGGSLAPAKTAWHLNLICSCLRCLKAAITSTFQTYLERSHLRKGDSL